MRRLGTGEHHVVCLHGWFGTASGWGLWPQVADTQRFSWWFPELRGYGDRIAETGDYSMAGYAADALAAVDAEGIGTFSVVGHSMGGKAAAVLLAAAPERVRAMVGISPIGPGVFALDDAGTDLFFGAAADPAKRRAILDFTTGGRNPAQWLDAMTSASVETTTRESFGGACDSWVLDDYTADAGQDTFILVTGGANDPGVPTGLVASSWEPYYPQVMVTELVGCGHYPMWETPLALARTIETFLTEF